MTVHAIALTGLENTAKSFRNELSALMFGATSTRPTGARSGVRYGTPTDTVSLSGFDGTVSPHAGIMDVQTSATAGPYFYAVTADENFTVNAAHATLARVDIVTIRIDDDTEDASGFEQATVNYKAGTAAGSPVAPSPDTTREMVIATIAVPASGGGNPVVSWVAPYAVAGGGIIPVRNNTERDALHAAYPGTTDAPLVVWVKSTAKFQYNSGSGWTDLVDLTDIETDITALQATNQVYDYRPANTTALNAITSMRAGDRAYQVDTTVGHRYNGSAWKPETNLPYVEYRLNAGQSIGNASETTVDLDASPAIARGTWSESTGVVTMPIAGFVLVTMGGTFASGGSPSLYQLRLFKNGTTDNVLSVYQAPAVSRVLNGSGVVRVAAGDTLRVRAFQNSGGPINLTETNAQVPLLSMQYVMAV